MGCLLGGMIALASASFLLRLFIPDEVGTDHVFEALTGQVSAVIGKPVPLYREEPARDRPALAGKTGPATGRVGLGRKAGSIRLRLADARGARHHNDGIRTGLERAGVVHHYHPAVLLSVAAVIEEGTVLHKINAALQDCRAAFW